MARRCFAILLAALFAGPLVVASVPLHDQAHAAAPKTKQKKQKKGTKAKPKPKAPPEEPPPRPRPRDEAAVLRTARAAGWLAPRTLEWEDQAVGRAPLVVVESGGKEQRRALLVGSGGSGKAARPTVAQLPIPGLEDDALVVARVRPFLQTTFGEVTVTVTRNDREQTTHAVVRAGATSVEIVCVFAGSAQGTTTADAGRARWVRTSQVKGANVPTFDVEVEEWGTERSGERAATTITRYQVPVADVCREIAPPTPVHGTVTIDAVELVAGEREEEPVRKIVKARAYAGLARCHDEALRDAPTLAGRVVVRLTISAAGRVTAARVTTDGTGHSGGWACFKGVLQALYFPVIRLPEEDEAEDEPKKKAQKEPEPTADVEVTLTLAPPPVDVAEEPTP